MGDPIAALSAAFGPTAAIVSINYDADGQEDHSMVYYFYGNIDMAQFSDNLTLLAGMPNRQNAANNGSTPQPSNRNQRIAQCIAQVRSAAKRSAEIIDVAQGVSLENAVVGCALTGPLIPECEAGVASVALLTAGVTYGAEQYQEHQDEAACANQQ